MALLAAALFIFALLMLLAGIWVLRSGERTVLRLQMSDQWHNVIALPQENKGGFSLSDSLLVRHLQRAGITLTTRKLIIGAAAALLLIALSWRLGGLLAAGVALGILLLAAVVWPQHKYHKRRDAIIAQIPLFLDQAVRSIAIGHNLDGALRIAAEEIGGPLGEVMNRVQQMVDLGADLSEALRGMAQLHDLHELHFITMAVRISRVHGASPREMLESISKLVRHRESSQRELKALTGETRLSAWLLGLLPSAMALYMLLVNPNYLGGMWSDPSGRIILLMAVGLQALGGFILWRMVKSV